MTLRLRWIGRRTDRIEDWIAWLLCAAGLGSSQVSAMASVPMKQLAESGRVEAVDPRLRSRHEWPR